MPFTNINFKGEFRSYQKRVLDHFNFGENPGYGADTEYGGAQGSIGWYGGEYEFIS